MKNKIYKLIYRIVPEKLNFLDILFYIIILSLCYLLFQQGDLFHTSSSSYAYLNGHFRDFYNYNKPLVGNNDYLPLLYIFFAIWNLPLMVFGLTHDVAIYGTFLTNVELIWTKALIVLFFFATAYIIYKIGNIVTTDLQKSKLVSSIFATSPIAIFAAFIFGQYDIIGVFFTMLGFYYYIKKDYLKFSMFFSIAISLKFFPIIIFTPLLLLIEKRIFQIIKYSIIACSATLLQVLLYFNNIAFRENFFSLAGGKITQLVTLNLSPLNNSPYLVIIFCIICIFAFIRKVNSDDEKNKLAIYLSLLSYGVLFSTVIWHPQWLIIIMPFFALAYIYTKDISKSFICDIVGMLAYIYITVNTWTQNVDVGMLKYGVIRSLITYIPIYNNEIFISKYTYIFMGVFFVYLFSPILVQFFQKNNTDIDDNLENNANVFRTRFYVGLAIFLIPTFFCAFAPKAIAQKINPLAYTYSGLSTTQNEKPAEPINQKTFIKQSFIAENDKLLCVSLQLATWARINECNVTLTLYDDSNKVLASQKLEGRTIEDSKFYNFRFNPVDGSKGKTYYIEIKSDGTENNSITAWMSKNDVYPSGRFYVNDVEQPGDLCMKLFYEYK